MITVATVDGVRDLTGKAELAGRQVTALTVGEDGSWAIVDGAGIWRRRPLGPWAEVAGAGPEPGLTCLVPWLGGLLVGASAGRLLAIERLGPDTGPSGAGRLVRVASFDRAPGREDWYTPWGGPPDTRSLAVAGDGTIYVNVHVGGILRSGDGGRSWSPTIDLHADVHQVLCPAPDRPGVVLAACADGLAQSRDGGESWRLRKDGLPRTYCRAVAAAGDTVVVSASEGPDALRSRLYRAPLEGWGGFQRCRAGLPEWLEGNVDTGWLAASEEIVAVATSGGKVFSSTDLGSSWCQVAAGLPAPRWLALA